MSDPEIAAYPFPFRVLEIRSGIALIARPRSVEVPVMKFLGLVDPALRHADQESPEALDAHRKLGEIQARVRREVAAEPDIRGVR